MSNFNSYWPVYKNLEKEFLELSDFIQIDDDQLEVYSMRIADLIVRCAIEIESISKDLYIRIGGNPNPLNPSSRSRKLYFDTDCLNLLEEKWKLGEKKLKVSARTVYFSQPENMMFTPLHKAYKRGSSGSKWKSAYQAIKHDRDKSLKQATIENLIHILGALFILNLYYKDEKIDVGRVYLSDSYFDERAGSDVFSTVVYTATSIQQKLDFDDSCILPPKENLEDCIFILKYNDESIRRMHENAINDLKITLQRFHESIIIKNYLSTHLEDLKELQYGDLKLSDVCLKAGGPGLLNSILCRYYTHGEKDIRKEAIVNKHVSIYPKLTLESK